MKESLSVLPYKNYSKHLFTKAKKVCKNERELKHSNKTKYYSHTVYSKAFIDRRKKLKRGFGAGGAHYREPK